MLSGTNILPVPRAMMRRRKETVLWCWVCVAMGQYLPCFCSTPYVATTAAQWTVFSHLSLSWNEASHFCKSLGGHLPVLNTKLRWNFFDAMVMNWYQQKFVSTDVWTGLFTTAVNNEPDRWEADCSLQPDDLKFWASDEPNDLDHDLCVRYRISTQNLCTKACSDEYNVVCEFDKGSCRKNTVSGSLRSPPNVFKTISVSPMESCWEQCMSFLSNSTGEECVGAVFGTTCVVYLDDTLISSVSTTTTTTVTTTMIKSCFDGNVSSCCSKYTYVDKNNPPRPAGDPCSITAVHSTTAASTQPQRSEARTTEQKTTEQRTTWPTAKMSSPTQLEATSTLATISSVSQDDVMLTTVNDRKITTDGAVQKVTTVEDKGSTEHLSMSSDLPGYRLTTVSDVTQDGSSATETSTTKVSQPLLCPCMNYRHNISETIQFPIVHLSTTSKYRRSLNSEWGSPDTFTSTSSATFVIVVGVAGFLFVVCDINRLTSLCGKKCFSNNSRR